MHEVIYESLKYVFYVDSFIINFLYDKTAILFILYTQ